MPAIVGLLTFIYSSVSARRVYIQTQFPFCFASLCNQVFRVAALVSIYLIIGMTTRLPGGSSLWKNPVSSTFIPIKFSLVVQ